MASTKPRTRTTRVTPVEPIKPLTAWEQLKADAGFDDPHVDISNRRILAGWVLGVAAGALTGVAFSSMVDYVVLAAITYTGSMFLATMIYVIGIILAVYAGIRAFNSVFGYIVSAQCTRHLAIATAATQRVLSVFNRDEVSHA